ncbi:MAG: PEP-CTERM sorting domain-containing protein [Caldimonas sp.]
MIDQAVPLSGTAIIGASDVEGQYGGFGFGYAFGNTDEYFDMYGFPLGPPVFSPSGPAAVTFQDGVPMGISYGEQHTKWELQHKEYIPVVIDFVYMSGGEFAINGGHGSIVFIVPVQEPSSLAMMVAGLGLLTLAGLRRMRR